MTQEQLEQQESAYVKKFFAICSKATRKELAIMSQVLTTFLDAIPREETEKKSNVAPAKTEAHQMAKSA